MTRSHITLLLKAGRRYGINLRLARSHSGSKAIVRVLDGLGYTTGFNPWVDINDAILLAINCCDRLEFCDGLVKAYPKGYTLSTQVKTGRIVGVDEKTMIFNMGNAIVNAANAVKD